MASVYGRMQKELDDIDAEDDPSHEDDMSPVPNITHRYPDRALFLCYITNADYTAGFVQEKER